MAKRNMQKGTLEGLTKAAAALGDPGRFRLFCYLTGGERCVCDLVDLVGLAPATVSRHLSLMREAGLVERLKRGRWHHYRIARSGAAVALGRRAADLVTGDPVIAADARRVPKRLACRNDEGPCGKKTATRDSQGSAILGQGSGDDVPA